jgi:hypothetical protein
MAGVHTVVPLENTGETLDFQMVRRRERKVSLYHGHGTAGPTIDEKQSLRIELDQ